MVSCYIKWGKNSWTYSSIKVKKDKIKLFAPTRVIINPSIYPLDIPWWHFLLIAATPGLPVGLLPAALQAHPLGPRTSLSKGIHIIYQYIFNAEFQIHPGIYRIRPRNYYMYMVTSEIVAQGTISVIWSVSVIWYFFLRKTPIFLHTYAICSELPTKISNKDPTL